jgi:hypothetical protein
MSALVTEVTFTDGYYLFHLDDGRIIGEELAKYEVFKNATKKQLENYQLIAGGDGVHWPDLDADLSVEGLLKEQASSEKIKRINITMPESLLEKLDKAIVGKYESRSQFFQKKAKEETLISH